MSQGEGGKVLRASTILGKSSWWLLDLINVLFLFLFLGPRSLHFERQLYLDPEVSMWVLSPALLHPKRCPWSSTPSARLY